MKNMKKLRLLILTAGAIIGTNVMGNDNVGSDKTFWINRLIPLPQEIEMLRDVTFDTAKMGVFVSDGEADELSIAAIAELRRFLHEKTGAGLDGSGFSIMLGVVDGENRLDGIKVPGINRLQDAVNADQGYVVMPRDDEQGLIVAALTSEGLWNGVRTLLQLLEAGLQGTPAVLPLVRIVDWPDMAERGVWNEPPDWFELWAPLKINYLDLRTRVQPFVRDEPAQLIVQEEQFAGGSRLGLRMSGRITHLNFFERPGIFRVYPELAGLGEGALAGRYHAHKQGSMHRVPNPNDPVLVRLITEMMQSLCEQGVQDISCWLTERPASDGRPATLAVGQFVLEARAFLAAWQMVRETYPDLTIRLFLSTTTDERYHIVCHEALPEVKIVRACATDGERFARLPRDLFANPLLDYYAGQGRWIGSYDVPLNANGKVETPAFKLPHRSAHRIRDFVGQLHRRGYSGAVGMMAFHKFAEEICGFNISALAEWGWNLNGRTPREFALAWATRAGYRNPEKVAEWAELMGPVEWDVYDSELAAAYSEGLFTAMISERRMPVLGEGFFRYYTTPESFDEKMNVCDRALELAGEIDNPDFRLETRVVRSYVRLARAIYHIAFKLAVDDLHTLEAQELLQSELRELAAAGEENVAAINEWRDAYGPPPWHARVRDAVSATEKTVKDITDWINFRYIY